MMYLPVESEAPDAEAYAMPCSWTLPHVEKGQGKYPDSRSLMNYNFTL